MIKKMLVGKSFLVESFPDQGKIFACGEIFSREKLPALITEKPLLVEKYFVVENWKTLLIKEKSQLAKRFFDHGKIIGLGLLKMKLYSKTNTSAEIIKICICQNLEQKLNWLTFLLWKFFCGKQNQYHFCFCKIRFCKNY